MRNTEGKLGRVSFTCLLLVGVGLVIGLSFTLSSTSRVFPLIVSIPAALLLILQLCQDIWPRVGEVIPFLRDQPIVEVEMPDELAEAAKGHSPGSAEARGMSEGRAFSWLLSLAVAIYFLHYLIVAPVFVLSFLRFEAKARWKVVIAVTGVMWLVLYLLFFRLLRIGY